MVHFVKPVLRARFPPIMSNMKYFHCSFGYRRLWAFVDFCFEFLEAKHGHWRGRRMTESQKMTSKHPPQCHHPERPTVNISMVSLRFLLELQLYGHAYLKQGNKTGPLMYFQFWIYLNFSSFLQGQYTLTVKDIQPLHKRLTQKAKISNGLRSCTSHHEQYQCILPEFSLGHANLLVYILFT